MPRWPIPQVDAPEPPPDPKPQTLTYDYQPLDPEGAENRTCPYDGLPVIVSDHPDSPGFGAIWRTTRKREGWRWVKTGKWVTPLLNVSLPFDPLYWRPISNLEHS